LLPVVELPELVAEFDTPLSTAAQLRFAFF
jgi:hypothetical protein